MQASGRGSVICCAIIVYAGCSCVAKRQELPHNTNRTGSCFVYCCSIVTNTLYCCNHIISFSIHSCAEDAACKRFQPNPNPSQNEMLFKPPSMCRASNAEDQDRNVVLTITCKPPATMTLNHLCQRRACVKLLNQHGKVEVCQRMVPKKKCRRQQ